VVSKIFIPVYLAAFVAANLLVKNYGAHGLWFSSFLLIPFDFVCRCIFHETWKGKKLIINLTALTLVSGLITFLINHEALNIALASFCGFIAAQIGAGIFYQKNKAKSWFYKVNVSDLIAICFDSIVFQLIAFHVINLNVTGGQIIIKFLGGLMWYFILFKWARLDKKLG
jgi:uncharacterized PurR-regulated membrane protein YhhQ (DUF165 family)